MIALERSVAVLLCAGLSRRYGPSNKLLALLEGKPLAMHAARLCAALPFAGRIAVVPPAEPALHAMLSDLGFDLAVNPDPPAGKDSSLRLGLGVALDRGASGALILLGDMPNVTAAHLRALFRAAGEQTVAISAAGEVLSPPTLIPAETAKRVLARGGAPVRASLGHSIAVVADKAILADYDYPRQFAVPAR